MARRAPAGPGGQSHYNDAMKAVLIEKQGAPVAPNINSVHDADKRVSGLEETPAGGVQIRTHASALNHMDIWVGMGIPGVDLTYPRVSGCDACGTVEKVGAGVSDEWVGKRVVFNAAVEIKRSPNPGEPTGATLAPEYELIGEHHHGAHRELFEVPATHIAEVGEGVSDTDAAAFGLTALTAYSMMITKGGLRPGQTVLITGIGGGVALAALAIAKWMGCPTVVTSRHQWKLDRASELGAEHGILDEGQDWSKQVRSWSHKRGVDMAVDSIGKPTHLNCIKSLARGGAFVTPGNTGGPKIESDQARIFWNQLRIFGSTMGTPDEFREVVALLNAGHLRPVVDQVFKWSDARDAWARLEAQDQFGNIVLDWTH
jgi:NADPH:quinone reductase-like Zn-dependent oxidoreductase